MSHGAADFAATYENLDFVFNFKQRFMLFWSNSVVSSLIL